MSTPRRTKHQTARLLLVEGSEVGCQASVGFPTTTTVVVLRYWYQSNRYGRGSRHGEVICTPILTPAAVAEIGEPFQGVEPQHTAEGAEKTNAIAVTALNANYDEMFLHTSVYSGGVRFTPHEDIVANE